MGELMVKRQRNDGLRKVCDCPRRTWPKCSHPWHFNFKWAGEHYRFSIEPVPNDVRASLIADLDN